MSLITGAHVMIFTRDDVRAAPRPSLITARAQRP